MRNIKEMQRALGVHVKTGLFDAEQLPPGNSTRFYPRYNAAPKMCMSKVDEENVSKKMLIIEKL